MGINKFPFLMIGLADDQQTRRRVFPRQESIQESIDEYNDDEQWDPELDSSMIPNEPISQHDSKPESTNLISLFLLLFLFRLGNSFLVITWFDPDETWQSLEVAHYKVFGNGILSWEWKLGIRSSLHPMIFAGVYKLIAILGLQDTLLLLRAPRFLQAFFAAITDFYAFKLSSRMFGFETGKWTLLCMVLNWFNFYCLIRTFSNSLEASLTMLALYFWPSHRIPPASRGDFRIALAVAAFCCILRPNSVLLWLFLGIKLLINYPHRTIPILFDVVTTCIWALIFSLSIDTLFYNRFVFTQW
jgi:phosphatidylinositol glycan class B